MFLSGILIRIRFVSIRMQNRGVVRHCAHKCDTSGHTNTKHINLYLLYHTHSTSVGALHLRGFICMTCFAGLKTHLPISGLMALVMSLSLHFFLAQFIKNSSLNSGLYTLLISSSSILKSLSEFFFKVKPFSFNILLYSVLSYNTKSLYCRVLISAMMDGPK